MYKLTLAQEERKAIDWIGNRYPHGDDFYKLLGKCEVDNIDVAWGNDRRDVTYNIPEHIAWEIRDLLIQEEYLTCLSEEFKIKLYKFVERIV